MTDVKVPDLGGATMNAVDVGADDFLHPYFGLEPEEQKRVFDSMPDYTFREDDIMLCAYPKCGTHWLYAVLTMLVNKTSNVDESAKKIKTMLEGPFGASIDKEPSPRILNCHYPPRYLPLKGISQKQIKTVVVFRHPKDVAVSYYNHMHGIKFYDYHGKWEDWLPVYLQGKVESGKLTMYMLQWEQLIEKGSRFPLHVMYYEDLKQNGYDEIEKLSAFLDVDIHDKLKKDVVHQCCFDTMAERSEKENVHDSILKGDFRFFRKGEVGDWKNWFSEAQNKMFDDIWHTEMKDSSMFKIRYP